MDKPTQPRTTELIEEHYAFVFGFLFRLSGSRADAEDLTQQTFLAAHANVHQLRDARKARSWLCTIGRNSFLKLVSTRNVTTVNLEALPEVADQSFTDFDIDEELLQSILDELPEEFRTTIVLFYFEGCSYREIAERMDAPIGTVMSRLARAKAHLRRRLGNRVHNVDGIHVKEGC